VALLVPLLVLATMGTARGVHHPATSGPSEDGRPGVFAWGTQWNPVTNEMLVGAYYLNFKVRRYDLAGNHSATSGTTATAAALHGRGRPPGRPIYVAD